MKAILVVDIGENQAEDVRVSYEVHQFAGDTLAKAYNRKMMLIPRKRKTVVCWKSIGGSSGIGSGISTHEYTDYDKGWNDCIEMLEGGEYE